MMTIKGRCDSNSSVSVSVLRQQFIPAGLKQLCTNSTCGRLVLQAGRADHSPVYVVSLLQRLLHLVHVGEHASDHWQQHEADDKGRLPAGVS